eukprot:CAMPEP_0178437818 /NCGR_PEP_ID=MMETSP0689_2-20121128/35219_1 /TAXON_ID=160604 /ORGANISM="Amphidinium massartii, Strain CS-259" /LENGTH=30 /DNA_ID= /DNA_START= /DNA_END= /DNA_ORIENTATION=
MAKEPTASIAFANSAAPIGIFIDWTLVLMV